MPTYQASGSATVGRHSLRPVYLSLGRHAADVLLVPRPRGSAALPFVIALTWLSWTYVEKPMLTHSPDLVCGFVSGEDRVPYLR